MTPKPLGPGDAKRRIPVLICVPGEPAQAGILTHWPIPAEQRRPGYRNGGRSSGTKATVLVRSEGARSLHRKVRPEHVHRIDEYQEVP